MKRCIKCKKNLLGKKFQKGKNACRSCRNKNSKKWQKKNPIRYRKVHLKCCADYYKKLKELRNGILFLNSCVVCGEKRIGCLDFHHINPKKKELCVRSCRSPEQIMREVAKCIVLCANCHRLYHLGEVQLSTELLPIKIMPSGGELEPAHSRNAHRLGLSR